MYFAGSNVSVTLSARPDALLPLKQNINELFIMPITKWRIEIENDKVIFYNHIDKNYEDVKIHESGPYAETGGINAILDLLITQYSGQFGLTASPVSAINNTDLGAFRKWVQEMKDKYNHIKNYETIELNALAIQFSSEQPSVPLFTPGDSKTVAYMHGTTMIQGSLTVNMDTAVDINYIDTDAPLNMFITYSGQLLDRQGENDTGVYKNQYEELQYAIADIYFMSRSHTATPSAENIVENLQFIGKLLLN